VSSSTSTAPPPSLISRMSTSLTLGRFRQSRRYAARFSGVGKDVVSSEASSIVAHLNATLCGRQEEEGMTEHQDACCRSNVNVFLTPACQPSDPVQATLGVCPAPESLAGGRIPRIAWTRKHADHAGQSLRNAEDHRSHVTFFDRDTDCRAEKKNSGLSSRAVNEVCFGRYRWCY